MTQLQRSILATVSYFDLFDYPLTMAELWHNLWQPPTDTTLALVYEAVTELPRLNYNNGLVTFIDRGQLASTRAERYLESNYKFKKRLPYITLLTYLPWVEAVLVVNSLAYSNASDQSDIDLLIITRPGKIWSTRFFTTTLTKILGIRPQPHHTKDTLCLSFYLTTDALNLMALSNSQADRHQAYWLSQAYPVYDPKNILTQLQAANTWLQPLLPYHLPVIPHPQRIIIHTWLHTTIQTILGWSTFEQTLKKLQLLILPSRLKRLSAQPEQLVVLSNTLLKFHTHDPRPTLEQQWLERMERYTI